MKQFLYGYMQVDKYITLRFTLRTHVRTAKDNKWWNVANRTETVRCRIATNGHAYFRLKHSSDSARVDDGFRLLWRVHAFRCPFADRSDLSSHFCGQHKKNGLRYIRIGRASDHKWSRAIWRLGVGLRLCENILVMSRVVEPVVNAMMIQFHLHCTQYSCQLLLFLYSHFYTKEQNVVSITSPFLPVTSAQCETKKGGNKNAIDPCWYQLTTFLAQVGIFIASFTNENHLIYTKR